MSVITELLILKMPPYIMPHAPPMHTTWTLQKQKVMQLSCSSHATHMHSHAHSHAAHMPLSCSSHATHMQLTCSSHATLVQLKCHVQLTCHSHAAHMHSHAAHMHLHAAHMPLTCHSCAHSHATHMDLCLPHLSVTLHCLFVLLNTASLYPCQLHIHLLQVVGHKFIDTTIAWLADHL